MSKIKNRILEAYYKAYEAVEEFYEKYDVFVNLIGFQFVLVFVTKITEKFANKIIK